MGSNRAQDISMNWTWNSSNNLVSNNTTHRHIYLHAKLLRINLLSTLAFTCDFIYLANHSRLKRYSNSDWFINLIDIDWNGKVDYCLGINFNCQCHLDGNVTITLSQEAFVNHLLKLTKLNGKHVQPAKTPYCLFMKNIGEANLTCSQSIFKIWVKCSWTTATTTICCQTRRASKHLCYLTY